MKKSTEFVVNIFVLACILCLVMCYVSGFKMGEIDRYNGDPNILTFAYVFLQSILFIIGPLINFYFIYFFFPGVLSTKKSIIVIVFSLIFSFIIGYMYHFIINGGTSIMTFFTITILAVFFGFLGAVTKKIALWRISLNKKTVEYKKLLENKTALLILQAQLNPHFLFNSLNNIDILIKETPDTASEYLKKLSDILRYVLYETKESETELSKEIEQIKSYIELQKIRTDNPHYVNFNIKGELKDQKIAPMIFIPFIENAFKHCKNKTIENAIDIEFELEKEKVKMICKNYYEENQLEIIKSEGLGIETIKQRLNLLYPKNHELMIDKTGNWFNVSLGIKHGLDSA
jgi:two-component system, LytTR family, sensor kinase